MFKKTKVGVAAAMLVGGAGLLAGAAQAQSTDQRVEITGSRILSIGAQSPAPVQVLTSEDIAKSGVTNVQELLLKLPSLGTPLISRTNSNFQTSSAGVATVDLRDLGTDRTLVLVNGRRFVSGLPGSAAVDLTTIPTDFIERVEILTGGASATYGSDAMAGVVNIILKKAFNGVVIDVRYGESSKGDDKKGVLSLTGGITSADGRSNIMAHFGYSKQGSVPGWTREPTDNIDNANFTGAPEDFFTFTTPFFSSFAPQGRIFFDTNGAAAGGAANRTFDRAGNIIPFSTNGPAGDGVGATGFNRQAQRFLAVPTERYLFATKGELALAADHSVFFEGTYANTQVKSQLEPFPLDSAAEVGGLYPAGGVGPAEFLYAGAIRANPLIPAGLLALMTDTNGDGLRDYSFTRRLSEVGNRGSTADRDTFRVLGGFKGTILKSWDYEAFAGYGATKEAQISGGQYNVVNFRNAMEAVPDVTDIDGDGNITEAICRDPQARAEGCVAANIFGYGTLTPEMLRYIIAPSMLVTLTSQKLAGGIVRGEPFSTPAGPVSLAVGAEWREEYSRAEFDPLQQAGLNGGNVIPRTEGEFHVSEVFAEVRVPLLKNLPGVRALTFNGAVRGADYSTVGSVSSWTAGLEWSPMADLRFRGTTARSTRAPNINELYSPPTQDFPTGIIDPCAGVTAAQTGTLADRCRAAPGVAANIAANGGTFTLNQADLQGISGFDRGNPNLNEEVGKSWTLGIVYTPSFLRNLSVELDFFKIDIEDAIVETPRNFILSQCYTGDASFCQFVTRRAAAVGANSPGSLSFVDASVTNSGGLATEGFDLTVNYADRIGPGRLNSRFAYTRLSKGSVTPLPGSEPDVYAGEIGSAKNKFALSLGYSMGPFSVATTTTYIGKSAVDDQLLVAGFGLPAGSVTVPSKTYLDLQLNYTLGKSTFYFGMDNALGTKPPRMDTNGSLVGTTGAGTAADVYDAIGRRYYVGVRLAL